MTYSPALAIPILERTPAILTELLKGLPEEWTHRNEGLGTWSPFDILGHLIHGEHTDWVTRMDIILSDQTDKTFPPFDRFAQEHESEGKTLPELLDTFAHVRAKNIKLLISKNLTDDDLQRTGIHPAFGEVTLSQLLSTWVVHDLNHLAQVARVMSKQYSQEVGPWAAYLSILKQK